MGQREEASSHQQEDLWSFLNRGPECVQLMGAGEGSGEEQTQGLSVCSPE